MGFKLLFIFNIAILVNATPLMSLVR